ncbi:hypothetical protein NC99_37260 [Sunxiuqinia dokdonensis]|uniref:Uncharacterized protein n=1 Tax=Sunxiuqinia dokdonensis TaxID=1409788 RepID=A0A0L8V5F0_9BACT|nr:hypothetical protein NC99_37260 [Sunxiuqinia dokdonensis]
MVKRQEFTTFDSNWRKSPSIFHFEHKASNVIRSKLTSKQRKVGWLKANKKN